MEKNKLRKVSFYCSTSVNQIPLQKFDLIVANPPHFSSRNQFSSEFVEDQIIYDFGWEAHRLFFDQIANYMTDNSLIILQENNRGSVTDDFRLFIHQSDLHILKSIGDKGVLTSEDNFYFILLRKNKSR